MRMAAKMKRTPTSLKIETRQRLSSSLVGTGEAACSASESRRRWVSSGSRTSVGANGSIGCVRGASSPSDAQQPIDRYARLRRYPQHPRDHDLEIRFGPSIYAPRTRRHFTGLEI